MARYYNKTRGPLTAPLRDGSAFVVGGKSWSVDVPKNLEGSTGLLRLCRKNLLIREQVIEKKPSSQEQVLEKKPSSGVASLPPKRVETKRVEEEAQRVAFFTKKRSAKKTKPKPKAEGSEVTTKRSSKE